MGTAGDCERFAWFHGLSREAGRIHSGDVQQGWLQLDDRELQVPIKVDDGPNVRIGGVPKVLPCGHLERAVLGQKCRYMLIGQHETLSEINPGSWKDTADRWYGKEKS